MFLGLSSRARPNGRVEGPRRRKCTEMTFESIFTRFVSRLLLKWKFLGKAAPLRRARQVATENRLSKCSGRPLGLCGQRLPELNLIPIQVIDPGKATVGFIHSFGVNLYSLLF